MEIFAEIRFWIQTALMLSIIVLLMTYPKMKGKGLLLSFAVLSLVTSMGFYVQRYLLHSNFLTRQSMEPLSLVFFIIGTAATVCLLVYVIELKEEKTSMEHPIAENQPNRTTMAFCRGCGKEINISAPTCPYCGTQQAIASVSYGDAIPDGIKGWSWGAFLLNWIWAIGNRTWIGLLAIIPYAGLIMAIILGVKGREWAWKNKQWESVEHFNRVQEKWSYWGVVIVFGWCSLMVIMIGIANIL